LFLPSILSRRFVTVYYLFTFCYDIIDKTCWHAEKQNLLLSFTTPDTGSPSFLIPQRSSPSKRPGVRILWYTFSKEEKKPRLTGDEIRRFAVVAVSWIDSGLRSCRVRARNRVLFRIRSRSFVYRTLSWTIVIPRI
jgi:hypothetical protein